MCQLRKKWPRAPQDVDTPDVGMDKPARDEPFVLNPGMMKVWRKKPVDVMLGQPEGVVKEGKPDYVCGLLERI